MIKKQVVNALKVFKETALVYAFLMIQQNPSSLALKHLHQKKLRIVNKIKPLSMGDANVTIRVSG